VHFTRGGRVICRPRATAAHRRVGSRLQAVISGYFIQVRKDAVIYLKWKNMTIDVVPPTRAMFAHFRSVKQLLTASIAVTSGILHIAVNLFV
jgi:hypothetical protein